MKRKAKKRWLALELAAILVLSSFSISNVSAAEIESGIETVTGTDEEASEEISVESEDNENTEEEDLIADISENPDEEVDNSDGSEDTEVSVNYALTSTAETLAESSNIENDTDLCEHGKDVASCSICAVQSLIDALPDVETLSGLDTDALNEIYTVAQEANDAWALLSEDEQAEVDDSRLDALFSYFNSMTTVSAEGAVARIGDNTYSSLEDAIKDASIDDTVVLLTDVTVDSTVTINTGITLDLGGYTVTASSDVSENVFDVPTTENVTICNGTIEGSDVVNARAIYVGGNSENRTFTLNAVTVQNFATSGNGGALYVLYGNAVIENCIFTNNHTTGTGSRGGAIYVNTFQTLTIIASTFDNNSTAYIGGAIGISNSNDKVLISGNTITNNTTTRGNGRCIGGGIGIISPKSAEITIENNIISNNTVKATGNYAAVGGGVGLYQTSGSDNANIVFKSNTITCNTAEGTSGQGGGIGIYMGDYTNNPSNSTIKIESGTIAYNTADWGGGIANVVKRTGAVYLNNALITENTAVRGGGVWSCPTSETAIYTTYGGAIYNNTATGQASNGATATGDEIRHEAADSDILAMGLINPAISDTSYLTVSPRALGGGLMEWYADEADARYESGDETVDVETDYTDRNKSFGLHGELDEEGITLAKNAATLLIYGNTATLYGGGVASNSPMYFGEDTESTVTVQKVWEDENGEEITDTSSLPGSVNVTLIRVDEYGNEQDLETVTLTSENDWTYTFENLPTNYTYRVKETTPDGYMVTYSEEEAIENENSGMDYFLTVINKPMEYTEISGTKTWDDNNDQDGIRPKSITITLYGGEEAVESVTVTAEDNWEYTFTDLPVYTSDGEEIEYSIVEDPVENYSTTYDGYNVTNSYTPEQTSVSVTKVWSDSSNVDGIRPSTVTITLLKNGVSTGQMLTLNADNNWTGSFTGLDKYTSGTENVYTVTETAVSGYTAAISGNAATGYVITNTHTVTATTTDDTIDDSGDTAEVTSEQGTVAEAVEAVETSSAATGDDAPIGIVIATAVLCALALIVITTAQKKKYR